MRQPLIALAIALTTGGLALADSPHGIKPTGAQPISITADIDHVDVYRDDFGKFYVSPHRATAASTELDERLVFYGDAKAMYRQRIIGSGSSNGGYEWTLWSPRVKGMAFATVSFDPGSGSVAVTCEFRDSKYLKKVLTQLTALETKKFLGTAKFYPPLWQRQANFLARDDDGVYYYVDRLQDDLGGKGYRVFVGQKGQLKEMPMTNIVTDSAGQIFATKTGELKIINSEGKAYWKRGSKKAELVILPPQDNRYLIYRELGIYGQLGVVCDEM